MEKAIIKFIQSLDRITDAFDKLVLRRTLLITYTILLLLQTITTTIIWLIYKDISTNWLGMIVAEHTTWVVMVSYYFKTRSKDE